MHRPRNWPKGASPAHTYGQGKRNLPSVPDVGRISKRQRATTWTSRHDPSAPPPKSGSTLRPGCDSRSKLAPDPAHVSGQAPLPCLDTGYRVLLRSRCLGMCGIGMSRSLAETLRHFTGTGGRLDRRIHHTEERADLPVLPDHLTFLRQEPRFSANAGWLPAAFHESTYSWVLARGASSFRRGRPSVANNQLSGAQCRQRGAIAAG